MENIGCAKQVESPLIQLNQIEKVYGSTVANHEVTLQIHQGDVLGLVGANGAGKSTLMRIVSGVTMPDGGSMRFDGQAVDWKSFRPVVASQMGIHVAYQELSLCDNLSVYENFYVELSKVFSKQGGWKKKAMAMAREKLDEIFPENGIDVAAELATLSIAQQQMVEIARAFSDPNLRLLILDEPTSSLPASQTKQFLKHIQAKAAEGVTFIYITHRLFEIMEATNKVAVMLNGELVATYNTKDVNEDKLIHLMSGGKEKQAAQVTARVGNTVEKNEDIYLKCNGLKNKGLQNVSCEMYGGEIIGIAGLEGNGQKELLRALFQPSFATRKCVSLSGKIAFVTGDRKAEGNFSLWSIADNMAITSLMRNSLMAVNSPEQVVQKTRLWYDKLKIKGESPKADIVSLSGGNQQKVLIARAMISDADIIILDDPTRGVDVETKGQLYEVFQEAAKDGKLIVWYSSDDAELNICNRLFVMRYGMIVETLQQEQISKESIVEASFKAKDVEKDQLVDKKIGFLENPLLIPVAAMLAIYIACGMIHSSTFTLFGAELLISGSMPLILAALSQTFIIGYSHVNLSIGNYMGLISVITATVLYENPLLGVFLLILAWVAYGLMGVLICKLEIPAVIVSLGFSFVWYGAALVLQSIPGGNAPELLATLFNGSALGIPNIIFILIATVAGAVALYRTGYGTALRGFGNREDAMVRSGWNKYRAAFSIYALSGFFAVLGGISFTALTFSADASSMDSYTLLTVASVVLGGGALSGGRVHHVGAACGAITLSLVTILLGFLRVSSDFTASVQGLLLILILSLRLLRKGEKQ